MDFTINQLGFRKGDHACTTQLPEVYDNWSNIIELIKILSSGYRDFC